MDLRAVAVARDIEPGRCIALVSGRAAPEEQQMFRLPSCQVSF